jgi:hypothetical protein
VLRDEWKQTLPVLVLLHRLNPRSYFSFSLHPGIQEKSRMHHGNRWSSQSFHSPSTSNSSETHIEQQYRSLQCPQQRVELLLHPGKTLPYKYFLHAHNLGRFDAIAVAVLFGQYESICIELLWYLVKESRVSRCSRAARQFSSQLKIIILRTCSHFCERRTESENKMGLYSATANEELQWKRT